MDCPMCGHKEIQSKQKSYLGNSIYFCPNCLESFESFHDHSLDVPETSDSTNRAEPLAAKLTRETPVTPLPANPRSLLRRLFAPATSLPQRATHRHRLFQWVIGQPRSIAIPYLVLIPTLIALGIAWFGIAPQFASNPDPALVDTSLFLEYIRWVVAPKPLDILRYLISITVVPGLFFALLHIYPTLASRYPQLQPISQVATFSIFSVQTFLLAAIVVNAQVGNSEPRYTPYGGLYLVAGVFIIGLSGLAWAIAQPVSRWLGRKAIAQSELPLGLQWRNWLGQTFRQAGEFCFRASGLQPFWRLSWPGAIVLGYTLLRLLPALSVNIEGFPDSAHLWWTFGEFAAIVNGATNLVDFLPNYQYVLAYLLQPIFHIVGLHIFSYTTMMVLLSLLGWWLIYRVLLAYTGGQWSALLMYIPFCAVSFFPLEAANPPPFRHSFNYFAIGPIRYFGCMVLLWLASRYFQKPTARRRLELFLAGGVVAMNNLDFGLPALVAILIAVVLTTDAGGFPRWPTLLRMTAWCGGCVLIVVLAFSGFTWLRSGQWPHWPHLTLFQQLYVKYGFGMVRTPELGMHWLIWLTFLAALAVGVYQCLARPAPWTDLERLQTGLLIFSGLWGFGVLTYYSRKSHAYELISVFMAWGLALTFLSWQQFQEGKRLLRDSSRSHQVIHALPALVLLFFYVNGWGNLITTPSPLFEVPRILTPGGYRQFQLPIVQFIRAHALPQEKVGIISPDAYDLANQAQVRNLLPFSQVYAIMMNAQIDLMMQQFDRAEVKQIFLGPDPIVELEQAIAKQYTLVAEQAGYRLWQKK